MEGDDDEEVRLSTSTSRKRESTGRVATVMKKMRAQTFETGPPCDCKRFRCFDVIDEGKRREIIQFFNNLGEYNKQNEYLAGLISLHHIQQRKCVNESSAQLHEMSYSYIVRVQRDGKTVEVPVCFKAFLSVHGIGKKRLQTIQKSLKETGCAPQDKRGHGMKKHKLPDDTYQAVVEHIGSFKGRESHYSRTKTSHVYLPSTLNIKKMHEMYLETGSPAVSYESYRNLFNTRFNLSFGYPRSDTCSSCENFLAEQKVLQKRFAEAKDDTTKALLLEELGKLTVANQVHKAKAETFYTRKKLARMGAMKKDDTEAIAMDYQTNLNLPNVATNDVYYRRQLTFQSFNIHVLSSGRAYFFCYDETIGGKGSNEVVSFLNHYIFACLDQNVRHLEIFCASCGGQNKNFTMIRYLHYIVHATKRLSSIKVTFPMRGHSNLECDRDMALVNQKIPAEIPRDWMSEIATCRTTPEPFIVVEVDQALIRNWSDFLDSSYCKTAPFKTKPIKEVVFTADHSRTIQLRDTYSGKFTSHIIAPPRSKDHNRRSREVYPIGQFCLPPQLYTGRRPICLEKYKDLLHLGQFCQSMAARRYFSKLKYRRSQKGKKSGTRKE